MPKRLGSGRPRKPRPGRIKRLRLGIILVGVGALAMVSTVFGMMMSIAGDIPALENETQYRAAQNSEVFDAEGRKIGTLLSNTQRRLVESEEISPYVKQAVVAIEDERFYEHRGVDFPGIARAVVQDLIPGGSTQGASTITQQFVKNALEAQGTRTYFQKLREAAYAYHLERQWDKDKILTQYLNTIYFGEGAYGIESAARTYFGNAHPECLVEGADPCSSELGPEEAALLGAIISQPGASSPRINPQGALERRNLVLQKMTEQENLTEEEFTDAADNTLPAPSDIEKPPEDSLSPYFTSWLRQQLVDRYGAGRAFGGGLDVHTTLDLDMQETAESIAYDTLAGIDPTASVVVIENSTGAVKAMVGGNDFEKEPFNIATNGQRQPGSAFKPFVLAAYLKAGGSPYDTYTSGAKDWIVPNSAGKERFHVENYEDNYLGSADVASATKYSDNSVFTEMGLGPPPGSKQGVLGGIRKGPREIATLAEDMGMRTEVDQIPAITLGAPSIGFTPLEMTYAFNAIAAGGKRIGSNLDSCAGNKNLDALCPTGITKIVNPEGDVQEKFEEKSQQVLPEGVADTTKSLLHGPVSSGGTGEDAQTPGDEWGKTGTTENHGDAWFCGGTDHLTACVWVGHAQNNTPMETEFGGQPVSGGTYPAQIWGSIMSSLEEIYETRLAEREAEEDDDEDGEESSDDSGDSSAPAPSYTPPSGGGGSGGGG
ncbi:MAG: transglycosylase domain-containing protein, partial [Solirubrobacterales bacterium]